MGKQLPCSKVVRAKLSQSAASPATFERGQPRFTHDEGVHSRPATSSWWQTIPVPSTSRVERRNLFGVAAKGSASDPVLQVGRFVQAIPPVTLGLTQPPHLFLDDFAVANHQAKGELKTPQQLSGKLTVLPKAYLFVNTVTLDGNALFGFVDQIQRSIKLHLVRRSQAISNDIQRGLLQPTENDAVFGLGKYGIRHLEPRGLGLQGAVKP